MKSVDDPRFNVPLYTGPEAASYLRVPRSTFETWVHGYVRRVGAVEVRYESVVTSSPQSGRQAEIPFIGLVEGMVVAAFRRTGVSMQEIRRALAILSDEIGVPHALASRRLYTDGAKILFDYAASAKTEELAGLTIVTSRQTVFAPVVSEYLRRIDYSDDDWASLLRLPISTRVIVDPNRSFGQPIFERGAVRLEDAMDRFRAGDSLRDVADDLGVPLEDLEEVIRGSLSSAA